MPGLFSCSSERSNWTTEDKNVKLRSSVTCFGVTVVKSTIFFLIFASSALNFKIYSAIFFYLMHPLQQKMEEALFL